MKESAWLRPNIWSNINDKDKKDKRAKGIQK